MLHFIEHRSAVPRTSIVIDTVFEKARMSRLPAAVGRGLLACAPIIFLALTGPVAADTPAPKPPKITEHGFGSAVPGDNRRCNKATARGLTKQVWINVCVPTGRTPTGGEWRRYEISHYECKRPNGSTFVQARITASISTKEPCGLKAYNDTLKMYQQLNGGTKITRLGGIYPPPRPMPGGSGKVGKVPNPRKTATGTDSPGNGNGGQSGKPPQQASGAPKGDKKTPTQTSGRQPPKGWDYVVFDKEGNPTYGMPNGSEITYNKDGGTTVKLPNGAKITHFPPKPLRLADGTVIMHTPPPRVELPKIAAPKPDKSNVETPKKGTSMKRTYVPNAHVPSEVRRTSKTSLRPVKTERRKISTHRNFTRKHRYARLNRMRAERSRMLRKRRIARRARAIQRARIARLRQARSYRRALRRNAASRRQVALRRQWLRERHSARVYQERRPSINPAVRTLLTIGVGMALNHGQRYRGGHRHRATKLRHHRSE